ncbi:OmpH family outer membrane protein [Polaribacter sp. MSW13]|uniref:OmpH family outer membrane protein n=1 Tax=Polaribacter marinus TaxID=2916838 RepID=A0A9X1VM10_9FLAO|nr:OmpH family outer membrane protein [Polaribacter marinus]MCI2228038.1 OmpH family outer membrane protein [Polaribacter marinus]
MKSKLFSLIIIALISTITTAQTKVGTINSDYIANLMPEAKRILELTQSYGARLDSSFAIKMKNYQEKVATFKKNEATMVETLRKETIKELLTLEEDLKKYQSNGNKLMQLKQNELKRPLYRKLNEAISEIAKSNGYTQILTTTGNQFMYIDERYDITKLVMEKLGVKAPEEPKSESKK